MQNNAPANSASDRAAQGGANASGTGQAESSANRAPADSAARNSEAATSSAVDAASRVNLDERQRTRLSQTFARLNARPLTNVNFSVAVGTVIPGDVKLQPLPADVAEIVPQYRGFDFVAVRDEIVIVDPASYKIVAVLPRGGSTAASTPTRRKVTFSDKDREAIRRHARSLPSSRVESRTTGSGVSTRMRIGDRIPDSVTIEVFPEEVYRDAPDVREYRYIRREDRTYVVEPEERRIIEEID
jgi:pyruvate/2-oxoglutarate dehydrogenase complex dihydrolipoamide acyltransferase (E2) component